MSHENSITVGLDSKFYNIPSVVDGKQLSEKEAVGLLKSGKLKPHSIHSNLDEAVSVAQQRSNNARYPRGEGMSDLNEYMDSVRRERQKSKSAEVDQLMGSVGLSNNGAPIPDWQPAPKKEIAPVNQPATSGLVRSVEDIWLGVREGSAGFYKLGANVFGLADQAADKVSQWTGMPKGGGLAMVSSFLKDTAMRVQPTERDLANRDYFIDYLYRAIGSAPVTIGTYIAGGSVVGSGIAGMAVIDALRVADQGAWEAIKGGLQGAMLGAGLKYIEPFSRPIRATLGATAFGGVAAAHGGSGAEIASQAVVGGGMAAIAPTKQREMPKSKAGGVTTVPDEGGGRVPKRDVIRQPDLTQKSETIEMGYQETQNPASTAKKDVIRQPDLATKSEPIEMPDLTMEGKPDPISAKMHEELESAKIEADSYIRERGIGAIYENMRRHMREPRLRKVLDRDQQRLQDEEVYGMIQDQVVNDATLRGGLGLPPKQELSAGRMMGLTKQAVPEQPRATAPTYDKAKIDADIAKLKEPMSELGSKDVASSLKKDIWTYDENVGEWSKLEAPTDISSNRGDWVFRGEKDGIKEFRNNEKGDYLSIELEAGSVREAHELALKKHSEYRDKFLENKDLDIEGAVKRAESADVASRRTPEEMAREDETTAILQKEAEIERSAATQIEQAAAELQIKPQNVVTAVKAVEVAQNPDTPAPTVTAVNTRTGKEETFTGAPGQRHPDVVLEHNLDSNTWEIKASGWSKGMPVTAEEAAHMKAFGTIVRDLRKKLGEEKGAVPFDPSRRKFLKAAAGTIAAVTSGKMGPITKAAAKITTKPLEIIETAILGEERGYMATHFSDGAKVFQYFRKRDLGEMTLVTPKGEIFKFDEAALDWDTYNATDVVKLNPTISIPTRFKEYVKMALNESLTGGNGVTTGMNLNEARLAARVDTYGVLKASEVPAAKVRLAAEHKLATEKLELSMAQQRVATDRLVNSPERQAMLRAEEVRADMWKKSGFDYNNTKYQEVFEKARDLESKYNKARDRYIETELKGKSIEDLREMQKNAQKAPEPELTSDAPTAEELAPLAKYQVYTLDEQGRMTPQGQEGFKSLAQESGFSTFDINFAIARTLGGAVYGYSQGDTIEERLKNALLYAGVGALANPFMIKTIANQFKRLDPNGVKAVEMRDAGLTPSVARSFDPNQKIDPKKMSEFLNMTNEGIEVEGRVNGINYDHINTPMDVKYVIGRMAKTYQDELNKIRKVEGVPHEDLIAKAQRLGESKAGAPEKMMQWPDGKPMTDPQLLLTRILRNDLGKGLQENTAKYLAEPTPENLTAFIDTFNKYRMVQGVYAGQATGRGRSLEALKIDVGNSGEVEFHRMIGDVVESVDPTGWTPERLAGAIAQVPNIEALNRAVDIAARPGMHDMLLEAFYGVAMLSNPKTWVVNGVSAPISLSWQVAKRSIAGGFTAVQGKIGDPNYVQPNEPLVMLQSIKDSYQDAFTVAKIAFEKGERQYPYSYGGKHGLARPAAITYDNLKALYPKPFDMAEQALSNMGIDAQKLKYGIDMLGHTARLSTRLMMAPDEFNELIGARMELYARSARSAAAESLSASQIAARAREKVYNQEGFSNADKEAAKTFALYNTFNQEPGSVTTRLTGTIEALNKSPDIDPVWYLATKAVVPFITIPANIARWAARESGPTAFLSRQLKEQMAKGGAEAQTAWAGVALGSMVLTLAANMAMNGYINGSAPVQKADRQVWEADGNIEYSFKTPVGSFGFNRLDPIAIPFAWAADFVNLAGHVDAYDSMTLAATAILTMTHDLASKNYVQGVTNFLHAITSMDSKEIQTFVMQQTGSMLVPGIVRGLRQEADPYRRATNTAMDAARQSTPWGSTDYPIVLDRFARPIYSGYGAGQGWVSIFGIINPIQYRAPNENRVIKEVTDNKIPIPGLSDTIFGAKDNPYDNKPANSMTGIKLEGWEYYVYNKYSGEKLFELLSKQVDTLQWKKASPGPDGGKALIFRVLTAAADEYARQRLLKESPELSKQLREKHGERKEALQPISIPGMQVPGY